MSGRPVDPTVPRIDPIPPPDTPCIVPVTPPTYPAAAQRVKASSGRFLTQMNFLAPFCYTVICDTSGAAVALPLFFFAAFPAAEQAPSELVGRELGRRSVIVELEEEFVITLVKPHAKVDRRVATQPTLGNSHGGILWQKGPGQCRAGNILHNGWRGSGVKLGVRAARRRWCPHQTHPGQQSGSRGALRGG